MSERDPRKGCVIVSVQLPRHLADLLAERRGDFMAIIELLGHECQHLPPTAEAQAEADQLIEQKERERRDKTKKLGRSGYRLYRRRIRTDGYLNAHSEHRDRPARLSKAQWRCIVMADIAEELGVSRELMELAISWFRKELLAKIKPRRDQAIIRLYLIGASNAEIADRVSVSTSFVSSFLKDNKDHIWNLFKALPETCKPLKRKERDVLPGNSLRADKKIPEKHLGKPPGESN